MGKAGKLGALVLRLEQDKSNGKTSVKDQYSRVPLFTQRALYLEEALPNMAYMYIMSPSGGILQGDRVQDGYIASKTCICPYHNAGGDENIQNGRELCHAGNQHRCWRRLLF